MATYLARKFLAPRPGMIVPRYVMPSHVAQLVQTPTGTGRTLTASTQAQRAGGAMSSIQAQRAGGAMSQSLTNSLTPAGPTGLLTLTFSAPPSIDWPGLIAVAKDVTQFSIRQWVTNSYIREQQTSIDGSVLTIREGALESTTYFEPTIHDALTNANAPPDVADAFSREVWSVWKEWYSRYSMIVPEAFPAFVAFPSPVAPPMPWGSAPPPPVPKPPSTQITPSADQLAYWPFPVPIPLDDPPSHAPPAPYASLLRGGSSGESWIWNLFSRIWGRLGTATQADSGASDAVQGYATWFQSSFVNWRVRAAIGTLLGHGPVPTFAPPYVPVGPVVGGTAKNVGAAIVGSDF
jgi:hypothetical protein